MTTDPTTTEDISAAMEAISAAAEAYTQLTTRDDRLSAFYVDAISAVAEAYIQLTTQDDRLASGEGKR